MPVERGRDIAGHTARRDSSAAVRVLYKTGGDIAIWAILALLNAPPVALRDQHPHIGRRASRESHLDCCHTRRMRRQLA
jgi:hypothetical protein